MTPITRLEQFIIDAVNSDPELSPVTRVEQYLYDIASSVTSTMTPITRIETYLAKISGADVEIPTPVTRIEKYLAALAGMDIDVPTPVTREELFLAYWVENAPHGEVVTVTGVSPLNLENAIARAIKSLTQTGLCTQASTPTPSAPVDIKCNNGVLKLVDDELPAGFKRLASIKFDGDFWYETGDVMTGDDDVTMTLDGTSTTGQNVFGSYNGTSSGTKNFSLFIYGGGSTSNSYLRYGEQLLRPRFGSGERTITFGKSGTSGFYTDATAEPDTFTTVAGAYIGMLPNSSSPAFTGKIIGAITVGTRLKWIPCERESDGVVGYYEAVKGVFLEPVGTGTPVKGDYDFSLSHLDVVGTPEVLTVTDEDSNTQTASVVTLLSVGSYADMQEIIGGAVTRACGITILTGEEEGWALSDSGTTHRFRGTKPDDCRTPASRAPLMSSHFVYVSAGQTQGGAFIGASQYWYFIPTDQTIDTADKWKTWLAEQYAAGTPVIIVYPLAEATTESVEEQSLSTVEGTNVVSVTAEVSQIALEVEYYAKSS